jgi:O-antigen/teichoic acid export membrane protein
MAPTARGHSPSQGMTRAVLRGGSLSALGQILTLAASLIATPFVIRLLGTRSYGLFALLNILIGYVAFADLGMSAASSKFGADAYAKGDARAEVSVVWTSALLAAIPAGLVGVALWIWARPIAVDFLHLAPDLVPVAVTGLRIASVGFVARALSGVLNTPQVVRMRWDLNVRITSGGAILQVISVPIVLALGGGLIAAVAVATGVSIATAAVHLVVSSRIQPVLWPPSIRRHLVRPLMRYGLAMVLSYGTFIFMSNVDRIILARVGSITEVAYYSVAAAAAAVLNIMPYAIAQPFLPGFSVLLAKDRRDEARSMYETLLRIMALALIPAVAVLFVVARPFFELWAGPAYADNSTVPFLILVVGVAGNAYGTIPGNVLMAADRVSTIARYHVAQLLPYVVVTVLLVAAFGPVGAAVAWAARGILTAALYLRAAGAVVPGTAGTGRRRLAAYVTAALIPGIPAAAVLLTSPPLLVGSAVMALALALYTGFVWARLLSMGERALIRRLISRRTSITGAA